MLKKILFVFLFPFIVNGQSAFISGNDTICDNGIPAEVIVNFSGQAPFSFTFAINGVIQPQLTQLQDDFFIISTKVGGVYTLTQFNDNINVGTTDGSVIVTVLESPTAVINLQTDTLAVIYPVANFVSITTGDIVSWEWDFGDNSINDISENPLHVFPDSLGIYQISLIVSDDLECSDTAYKVVYVINHEQDESYWMYIPNSFTPDLDGLNDKFCLEFNSIQKESFIFKVFNSQGDLIFQTTTSSDLRCSSFGGWDGTHFKTNKDLPSDIYVFEVTYKEEKGWKHQEYGTIILVR